MSLKIYKNANRVLFGFTIRKNYKQAIIIALLSIVTILSTAIGFANAYPTEASRKLIAITFANNSGLKALIGKPENIDTIAGFTAWRSLGVLLLIVSIWAIFLSTRIFRGDEEQGRLELILTGKTNLFNATKQLYLAAIVLLIPVIVLVSFSVFGISYIKDFGWSITDAIVIAITIAVAALTFISIGAFVSQIAPTRATALKIAASVFGIAFLLRSLGDISSKYSWLANLSPLGWLENIRPISENNVLWFMPLLILICICILATLILANRRDYGASLIPDKDSVLPKYGLLKNGNQLLIRLHKTNAFIWVISFFIFNFIFGTFLSAATEALTESDGMQKAIDNITKSSQAGLNELFVGLIYMQMTLILLIMVAGQVSSLREQESRGYLDNLLVRQSSRLGLSVTKLLLIITSVIICCSAITLGTYLGAKTQGISLDLPLLFKSGINLFAVPILLTGIGFLIFGILPRLTSLILYILIGWAFLIEIIGSVIKINHWVLDTSILHHIALAPATPINWQTYYIFLLISTVLAIGGIWRFTRRDIELM